jgi:hypothetical protein
VAGVFILITCYVELKIKNVPLNNHSYYKKIIISRNCVKYLNKDWAIFFCGTDEILAVCCVNYNGFNQC